MPPPRTSLIVTCHPSPASRCAEITRRIAELLRSGGRTVIIDDLVATDFDPVLSRAELQQYYGDAVPADIAGLVAHLKEATDLYYVLPLWMFDMPALLKGYFERVFRPHVAFRFAGNDIIPLLTHVRHLTVVVTHGRDREETERSGDGTRVFFERSLPSLLPSLETNTRFDFYDLDGSADHTHDAVRDELWRHVRASTGS